MAKWIFQFRSAGKRPLSEAERASLERVLAGMRTGRVVKKAVSWAFFALALASLWAALQIAGGYGVLTLILASVGGVVRSTDYGSERRALLYERLLRIGEVERFQRVEGDSTVRELWHLPTRPYAEDATEEEDQEEFSPQEMPVWGAFWEAEERFEKSLVQLVGRRADWFEAVGDDGAIVFVEGVRPDNYLDVRVWKGR